MFLIHWNDLYQWNFCRLWDLIEYLCFVVWQSYLFCIEIILFESLILINWMPALPFNLLFIEWYLNLCVTMQIPKCLNSYGSRSIKSRYWPEFHHFQSTTQFGQRLEIHLYILNDGYSGEAFCLLFVFRNMLEVNSFERIHEPKWKWTIQALKKKDPWPTILAKLWIFPPPSPQLLFGVLVSIFHFF